MMFIAFARTHLERELWRVERELYRIINRLDDLEDADPERDMSHLEDKREALYERCQNLEAQIETLDGDDLEQAEILATEIRTRYRLERALNGLPKSLAGVDIFSIPLYFPDE